MNYSELLYNLFVENNITSAILLAFLVVYLIKRSVRAHIGLYVTIKYFSMIILIIISLWFFIYTGININSELDAKENFQLIAVFVASLSIFLITLDIEYTKNFNDLKDLTLDSKVYVPFSQKVGDSKFQFPNMVHTATTSIFIVGPNLAFLSKNEEDMKKILFDKFRANSKFEIKMLIMDPRNKDKLDIKSLGFNDHFWGELRESVKVFKEWAEEAKNGKANYVFDVRVTDVLTLSLLFKDKSTPDGCVLVTPIPNGSQGANRSCFLIKKKSYDMAFYEYYDAYNKLFGESESIEKIID